MDISLKRFNKRNLLLSILFSLGIIGCKVTLIGAYDQTIEQNIQKLQKEVLTIIVKLERNLDSKSLNDNDYNHFKSSYENIAIDIENLKIRCGSIAKYNLVLEQVNLVDTNIKNLEKLHKLGFDKMEEIAPIKSAFETQFGAMINLQEALKREKNK